MVAPVRKLRFFSFRFHGTKRNKASMPAYLLSSGALNAVLLTFEAAKS